MRRFTTFERFERPRLFAIKRDGSRQEFSRDKIFESMRVACGKRPVSVDTLREAVDRIERDVFQEFEDEVRTSEIGWRVLQELAGIDTVGYVRFASVYREFETVHDFAEMVERVQQEQEMNTARQLQESLL